MRKLQLIAVLFAFICVTNVTFANNSDEESANDEQQWDTSMFFLNIFTSLFIIQIDKSYILI